MSNHEVSFKGFTGFTWKFFLLLVLSISLTCCGAKGPPRNCLILMIDSLRPDHLGCYGYKRDTCPAIDRLAKEGALFQNAFSTTSWTLPAHAALFTSLFDSAHGASTDAKVLNQSRITLAEVCKQHGYRTAGFYTGPYLSYVYGLSQGFDTYENCATQKTDKWLSEINGLTKAHHLSHEDITSPRITKRALEWLEENRVEPFFLFLHFFDVHYDYIPPPPFDRKFDPDYTGTIDAKNFFFNKAINKNMPRQDLEHILALYDGEIAYVDSHIDKILKKLKTWNLLDNTLVILMGDHGEEFFEHGFKGHRRTLYDESVRIPLIFRLPSAIPAERTVSSLVRIIDVMPSVLDILRLPAPEEGIGTSLLSYMQTGSGSDLPIFTEISHVNKKLISFRNKEWKVLFNTASNRAALFDLSRDRKERWPIPSLETPKGGELMETLFSWIRRNQDLYKKLPRAKEKKLELSEDMKKQLKALGYLTEEEEEAPIPKEKNSPENPK